MDAKTFIGRINQIKSSPERLKAEDQRLSDLMDQLRHSIEEKLDANNIAALLTSLGLQELSRVSSGVDYEVSDFAGFARYLRGLAAKKSFTDLKPKRSLGEAELMETCESIWKLLLYREMIRGFIRDIAKPDKRRIPAGMMNVMSAVQGPLAYIDDAYERVRGLYSQFSAEVIEPSIGLSVEAVLQAFERVREVIPSRVNLIDDMREGVRRFHQIHNNAPDSIQSVEEMRTYLESQPGFDTAGQDFKESFVLQERLFVFQEKDLRDCLGSKAKAFLDAFSFQPGTVNHDYALPFDTSVHRSRPFARIDDGYLLVDPSYCFFAPQHRLDECFSTERLRERLIKRRDAELEDVAERLFKKIVGTGDKYRSYYIPINKNGDLAERDLLFIHDGVAFVIESKARPLRDAGANIDKIEGDFKRTIQEGYEQCTSVCAYLKSDNGIVPIFDSNKPSRRVLVNIDTSKIRRIVPIIFLDAYYGFISTDLAPWLQLNMDVGYPWAVDRDAMSSFILKFSNVDQFLQFFDWRRSVYGVAFNEDELCFAGYFLRHGPNPFPNGTDFVQLDQNYSDIFEEENFRRKGYDIPEKSDFTGEPHWAGIKRDGESMVFTNNGQVTESVDTITGEIATSKSMGNRKRKGPGRNDPCPCNSGRKYKKCCGSRD